MSDKKAPTSDERREVAARLRDDCPGYSTEYDFFLHALGMSREEGRGPCDWTEVHKRLADLIDPTCHLVGTTLQTWTDGTHAFYHELSCGHTCETVWAKPPEYCPECGARVVSDDD